MSATSREFAAKRHKRNSEFQIWTHENHAVEFITNKFIDQKLNYIYENPVRAGIVYKAEDYMYSSASNYILGEGIINVKILEWNQRFQYTATESETLPNGGSFTFVSLAHTWHFHNAFSSFRSTPYNYSHSTERRFATSACTAIAIDLLSSFIQHLLIGGNSLHKAIHGAPSPNRGFIIAPT